jgi:hypothetical protein
LAFFDPEFMVEFAVSRNRMRWLIAVSKESTLAITMSTFAADALH